MQERKVKILKILDRKTNAEERIINDYEKLAWVISVFKAEGLVVGYTMGSFDMYHVGHVRYVEKARDLCDILVVGIDSDDLIRARKGEGRPKDSVDERIEVLLSNRSIDIITIRHNDDDPYALVRQIKPDILVLSETTQDRPNYIEELKEGYRGYVKDIVVFPRQAATSTTARLRMDMIEKKGGTQ
jgi:D-glycero-beta-D-manno-heptose 1-phosphate adenylyltransferase